MNDNSLIWEAFLAETDKLAHMPGFGGDELPKLPDLPDLSIPSPEDKIAREDLPQGRRLTKLELWMAAHNVPDPKTGRQWIVPNFHPAVWSTWRTVLPDLFSRVAPFDADIEANRDNMENAWKAWAAKNPWLTPNRAYWNYPGNWRYKPHWGDGRVRALPVGNGQPELQPEHLKNVMRKAFEEEWKSTVIPPLPK